MAGNLQDIIPSFFIGKNGEKLTPEQIKRRQGLANNAMLVATDTSPNAGGIASILAKGVAGLRAGYEDGRANDAIAANSASSQANIAKLLSGLGVTGGLSQGTTVATPTTAPVQGISGGSQTGAPVVAEGEIADYIRQAATARGIDPDTALRVAMSEGGLKDPVRQSDYVKNGVREASYGPFQLYMGGGLGNKALEAGIDPRDPNQWRQGVDFALDQAATGGWSPWYGAAKVGLGNRAGLENARAIGFNQQPSADSPTAAIETVSPSSGYVDPMVSARPNAAAALPPQTTSPVQPSQSSINPAVVEALSSPYASSEEKQIASLLLERQMGEQQQQQKLALAQQQRQQEIARRQAIAQQTGIDPAYAADDDTWKAAAGNIFAAPSTSTVNGNVIDNRTREVIFSAPPEPTTGQRDYRSYADYETQSGRTPLGPLEYEQALRRSGANNQTISLGGNEFDKELGGLDAKALGEISNTGMAAQRNVGRIDQLDNLLKETPSGAEANFKLLAGNYGINLGPDTSNVQAAQAIINSLVPEQRQPGSGPMSDADLDLFKKSLPSLINQPGGNQQIINNMRGIAQYDADGARIVQRLRLPDGDPQKLNRAQAFEMLQKRTNPLANFKVPERTQQETPTPDGWKDAGNGIRIRPKGVN